jgi:hypothetical protein
LYPRTGPLRNIKAGPFTSVQNIAPWSPQPLESAEVFWKQHHNSTSPSAQSCFLHSLTDVKPEIMPW